MITKIPKFKSDAEESEWFYKNRNKIKWGKPILDKEGKPMKADQIAAEYIARQKQTQPITIRLTKADVQLAKAQAIEKGLPYQTYLKSVIHQALKQLADVPSASPRSS